MGSKPTFFMNGGDQLMIKDNIITAISSFLSSEDLELYDLNIAGNEYHLWLMVYGLSSCLFPKKVFIRTLLHVL